LALADVSGSVMDELAANARHWGVEPGYHDVFGHWHDVPEESLRAIVAAISQGRERPAALDRPATGELAFQGDGSKLWALAIQLYAIRSRRNWGIGDFGDLQAAIELAADAGASAIGLNPLHALFLDQPENASPYGPNSRLFLNPLYIAVDRVPGFEPDAQFEREAQSCREPALVDYSRVALLKTKALRLAYERFQRAAAREWCDDFEAFRRERGESLAKFSSFEVLRARYPGRPWREWPEALAAAEPGALADVRKSETEECGFIEYLQWLAHGQLMECRDIAARKGMTVGLYLDLAVGVDPNGADAWAHQRTILAGLSAGAPPDEFNPAGQNWGLAPFSPHALADHDFRLMRELLSSAMRYAGAVRLDHVLGLKRLFIIPKGMDAKEGAYVLFPFEQLLQVVAQESNKHRCIFIGEDLGTVPEGFRETTARWGIWTYRVMIFERWPNGEFNGPQHYPVAALAAFNTHDLPTFSGWMSAADLAVKRAIGIDPGETGESRAGAQAALREALGQFAGPNAVDSFAAAAGFLAATPSRLVSIAIEDMLDVVDQVNIPGTVDQYPNWRRKLPVSLEQWTSQPSFNAVCAAFDYAGRSRKR